MSLRPGALRLRPGAAALLLVAATAGWLAGCEGDSPAADLRLLPAPTAFGAPGGVPIGDAGRERRGGSAGAVAAGGGAIATEPVRIADSERVAVRTGAGSPVRLELPARKGGGRLELAAAAASGHGGGPVSIAVRLADAATEPADGSAELLHDEIHPADGWVRHELDLPPARSPIAIQLESDGPAAWAGLWLLGEDGRSAGASPEAPNLILISLDTVRADHLSLYGYPRPTSPNLDRFAADAWVFERSYSTSTWTPPSHASMFTGLLPDQHGVRRLHDTLAPEAVTAAEVLREAGYRTAAITDGGFLDPRWGLGQGFDRFDVTPGQPWEPKDAEVVFDRAARWVRENRQRPFFLFVHTYEAHQPYDNRGGFADPFLDPGYDGPYAERADVTASRRALEPGELPRVVGLYDGGLRRTDHYLGRFLRTLARRGMLDDTAVIVTSDHGEELGEHGDLEHMVGKVFDENVRVPLVVRPPGGVRAGGVDGEDLRPRAPVSGLDLLPTLLDLAGIDRDTLPPLVGRSLLDLTAAPAGGGAAPADRTLVIQGLSSLPQIEERRFRLDRGARTLIYDQVRGTGARYLRDRDPGMQRPLPPVGGDGDGDGLVGRLQAVLAWLQPGAVSVRLPPAAAGVRLPAGTGLAARGAWAGLEWRPADGGPDLALDPALPSLAVLETGGGPAARGLAVIAADGSASELRLEGPVASPIGPPEDGLPPPGLLFESAGRLTGGRAEIDAEQAAELRALGYL